MGIEEDDDLISLLRAALSEMDPVPEDARRFAVESHRLISLEYELAALASDTLDSPAAMRSLGAARLLRFERDGIAISVEVGENEVRGSIEGQTPEALMVQTAAETPPLDAAPLTLSPRGVFRFALPQSSFRLMVVNESSMIRTEWIGIIRT